METLTQKGLSMILYMSQDMEINSTQKKKMLQRYQFSNLRLNLGASTIALVDSV